MNPLHDVSCPYPLRGPCACGLADMVHRDSLRSKARSIDQSFIVIGYINPHSVELLDEARNEGFIQPSTLWADSDKNHPIPVYIRSEKPITVDRDADADRRLAQSLEYDRDECTSREGHTTSAILRELAGRGGYKELWSDLDQELRDEIRDTIRAIIRQTP